ncbi:PmoA family protein [Nonomuraea sp. NPDC050663]|uniref:PmoA family protein n=1 Tax=Nonomuraea sp. NPDC050663 TaxID=3364370 RepID=UPI0037B817EF
MKDTGSELIYEVDGVELFRYVYLPDMPTSESPKPYFHPLRTRAGNLVSSYRPNDHRWHKGLQFTASEVSGENFWGGPSYTRADQAYVGLPNNGSMRHEEWVSEGVERLTWWTQAGEHWVDETRTLAVDHGDDWWSLDFSTRLVNVRDQDLVFGSPTTNGRELAGYTGLFWRGPRDFTHGTVISPTGQAEMMGEKAPWLAYVAEHDEVDAHSTLLFVSHPEQVWFVRREPFAAVNPSFAFFEEVRLAPGEELGLSHRVVVGDGAWDAERLREFA